MPTVTPTGVPILGYDVTIYGDSNNDNRTMNYTIGGTTQTINDSGEYSGSFSGFTTAFPNLTTPTFTIFGNPNAGDSRSAINGIVISHVVPEPSRALLIGVATMAILLQKSRS